LGVDPGVDCKDCSTGEGVSNCFELTERICRRSISIPETSDAEYTGEDTEDTGEDTGVGVGLQDDAQVGEDEGESFFVPNRHISNLLFCLNSQLVIS
jgi:hypothetical protein